MREFKIAVIGGGPGGYTAAIRAAQLGASVVLIEKNKLGGMCLHYGCIPTKALLRASGFLRTFEKARECGVNALNVSADFKKMQERKESIVTGLHASLERLLKNNTITIINGKGRIIFPDKISVAAENYEEIIRAEKIILAPGSLPAIPPIPGVLDAGIMTTTDMLNIQRVPASLLIVGGGVSGVEFATIFSTLGTRVILVEKEPRVVPGEDEEISIAVKNLLKSYGVKVFTGCRIKGVKKDSIGVNTATLHMENEDKEIYAEVVLSCCGRRPTIDDCGIERLGIVEEKGFIPVNRMMETASPGVYAVGDAVGGPMLAHAASMEGIIAAENSLGAYRFMDFTAIPRVIDCQPEVAAVGLTENEAKASRKDVKIGRFMLSANSMASILREKGFVKIVSNAEDGKVLGIHIISPGASELIGEAALAMKLGASARDIEDTIHNHPSFSEGFAEAARASTGKAIHIMRGATS